MNRLLLVVLLAIGLTACGAGGDQPVDSSDPTPPTTSGGTIPADAGPVFVDSTDILLMESFPVQVALSVTGNLPTPCHEPVWKVVDDGTTISVTLASVTDPSVMCNQVLEPFQLSIPLGAFESGRRTVTLNGTEVGEFDI